MRRKRMTKKMAARAHSTRAKNDACAKARVAFQKKMGSRLTTKQQLMSAVSLVQRACKITQCQRIFGNASHR